jgi:hypothetical protein
MFKICSSYIHGTRGFMNQIKENLIDQQDFKSDVHDIIEQIEDQEMKSFLISHHKKKNVIDLLLFKSVFQRTTSNNNLYNYVKSLSISSTIHTSERAIINKIGNSVLKLFDT